MVNATARQQNLSQEMTRDAQKLVELTEQRLKVGAGSEKDVVQARASLASYQDAAQQVQLAHRQAVRALEILLGRYPAAELQAHATLPAFPTATPVGTPAQALDRRPDLLAAQHRVEAAFNRVGESRAAMLPTLSLSANLGWVDKDNGLDTDAARSSDTRSVGMNAFAPLYTGGALQGNVALRTQEQEQAIANYGSVVLQAMTEVENALDAENMLAQRERSLQDAVTHNRQALALEQDGFKIGRNDLRSVTQNQLTAYAAKLALLLVQRERLDRRVDLHLALGGDFVDGAAPVAASAVTSASATPATPASSP